MTIDDLKKVLEESDLGVVLPDLNAIMDKMAPIMRIALLAGPVLLLGLGLLYLFASPKEANYKFGYRCYFGMGSVRAWRYSQRLAGILYTAVGLILTLVMFSITGKFQDMDIMDMLWKAVKCGLWEAGIILLTTLTINCTVAFYFDRKGHLRRKKKAARPKPVAEDADGFEVLSTETESREPAEVEAEAPIDAAFEETIDAELEELIEEELEESIEPEFEEPLDTEEETYV